MAFGTDFYGGAFYGGAPLLAAGSGNAPIFISEAWTTTEAVATGNAAIVRNFDLREIFYLSDILFTDLVTQQLDDFSFVETVSTTGLTSGLSQISVSEIFFVNDSQFNVVSDGGGVIITPPPPPPIVPDFDFGETWAVDGVSLQTYAYNIVTWGASRQEPIKLKGGNTPIPFRAGSRWYKKSLDSRVISLAMWVIGANAAGQGNSRQQFEMNWRKLRRLLWTPDREIVLTKTFYDDVSNSFITAKAKAQYVGGLSPDMNGQRRASFVVDLMLADPLFYDVVSKTIRVNSVVGDVSDAVLTAFGDYPTTRLSMEFVGPLVNPKLTNIANGVVVQINETLSPGEFVHLDVDTFSATKNQFGTVTSALASVDHAGDFHWMRIGGNDVKFTGGTVDQLRLTSSGTVDGGYVQIGATPVWL